MTYLILFTLYRNGFLEQNALSVGVTAVISKTDSVKVLVTRARDLLRAA
jgi:hypothetical protein